MALAVRDVAGLLMFAQFAIANIDNCALDSSQPDTIAATGSSSNIENDTLVNYGPGSLLNDIRAG